MGCGCSIEIDTDDEGPSFIHESERKARKRHKCCECKRTIEPGESYHNEAGLWGGRFDTYKTCADCLSLRAAFFCGFFYGRIWMDFQEQMQETSGDFNQAALAKLTPAARERACKIIEYVWSDLDDEEDEDAA